MAVREGAYLGEYNVHRNIFERNCFERIPISSGNLMPYPYMHGYSMWYKLNNPDFCRLTLLLPPFSFSFLSSTTDHAVELHDLSLTIYERAQVAFLSC